LQTIYKVIKDRYIQWHHSFSLNQVTDPNSLTFSSSNHQALVKQVFIFPKQLHQLVKQLTQHLNRHFNALTQNCSTLVLPLLPHIELRNYRQEFLQQHLLLSSKFCILKIHLKEVCIDYYLKAYLLQ